ncbi:NBR1-Ig-like domain-containing protein [Krasilnikovia sp. MM14-A1259]|uniref:NBR1-Ig-like domain-containing protein n=1 Tax=Krasilnikovia sp. MM14-A1259 TaxID=3373539 RepID=UPI0038063CAE
MNREVSPVAADGVGQVGPLAEQLRDLRDRAGRPSFRVMAGRSGRISHTTLHEAAAGHRFPSWETTREFVRACGGNETEWRGRWERAQRATGTPPDPSRSTTTDVPGSSDSPAGAVDPPAVEAGEPAPTTTMDVASSPAAAKPAVLAPAEKEPAPTGPTAGRPAATRSPRAGGLSQDRRSILWAAATVLVVLSAVALVQVVGSGHNPPAVAAGDSAGTSATTPTVPVSADPSKPLIPGDASKFVGDITVQDGDHYKVNQEFTKVWAIANTGTVGWHGRYLVPKDPPGKDDGTECRYPQRVPIGDTLPGEQVHISVHVKAPRKPGVCWVGWKMVDASGRMFFPSRRPVFFLVNIDPE